MIGCCVGVVVVDVDILDIAGDGVADDGTLTAAGNVNEFRPCVAGVRCCACDAGVDMVDGGSDNEPVARRVAEGDTLVDVVVGIVAVEVGAVAGVSTTRTSYTCKIRLREPNINSIRPSSSISAIHAAEMLQGTRNDNVGVRRRVGIVVDGDVDVLL